ncbi:hypothetical protein Pla52n_17180 [Stieleria varia]|uniref:Uncharacterized protein n=1 Tax=Stieleria varia TaxID=2528005 RepID=A0A5C6B3A7_9BACT|nr:hypothetical protein Pla52n_17180 [Stieleria varia]
MDAAFGEPDNTLFSEASPGWSSRCPGAGGHWTTSIANHDATAWATYPHEASPSRLSLFLPAFTMRLSPAILHFSVPPCENCNKPPSNC